MSDWWDTQTATDAAPAPAPEPTKRKTRKAAAPATPGIPFADAWVLFRWSEESGHAEDVRIVRGEFLNRLRVGEPRDWTHDLPAYTWGDTPAEAWRSFVGEWGLGRSAPPQWQAARAWAAIEGLDHLAVMADYAEKNQ